jgi:hypothetical protein
MRGLADLFAAFLRRDKAFLGLLAARVIQLGNALLVSLLLLWVHGLEAAGTYAVAALPITAANILCALGLASSLPRSRLSPGQCATVGLVASSLALIPAAIACVVYALVFGHTREEAMVIFLFAFGGGFLGQVTVILSLSVVQGRTSLAPVAPSIHLLGTLAAACMTDLPGFALVVAATRIVGVLAGFACLSFSWTRWHELRDASSEGVGFMRLDLLAMASEFAVVPLLAICLTRAEMGIFGIARQFVTVADTPGWAFVQSRYPDLVRGLRNIGPRVARQNEHLAWLAGAACFLVAAALAAVVYDLPSLPVILLVLLVPLPARYMNNFCEQALRASGNVAVCTALATAKLVLPSCCSRP